MDLINNAKISASGVLNAATSVALYIGNNTQEKDVIFYKHQDDKGNREEIFKGIGILSCDVNETSKLMEHPLEDGSTVVDHEIKNQIEVSLQLLVSKYGNDDAFNELLDYYNNGYKIDIKTKKEFCSNMVIVGKPYSIASNVLDKIVYKVSLKQVFTANTKYLALPTKRVKNPSDSSTNKGGNIQAQEQNKSLGIKLLEKIRG